VVTEDGVVQAVSFCEYQKMQEAAAGRARRASPGAGGGGPSCAGYAGADRAERPGDVRYKDRRLLALYFDMSAMPVPDSCARKPRPSSSSERRCSRRT